MWSPQNVAVNKTGTLNNQVQRERARDPRLPSQMRRESLKVMFLRRKKEMWRGGVSE